MIQALNNDPLIISHYFILFHTPNEYNVSVEVRSKRTRTFFIPVQKG